MNRINFLPSTYVQQQARKSWVFREALWIAATLVLIAGWFLTARGGLTELREYKQALALEAEAAKAQKDEVVKLQAQQKALFEAQKLQRKLVDPVRNSSLLATISQLMPSSIVLRDFDLNGTRPLPSTRNPNAEIAEGERRPEKEKVPDPIRISMTGIASADSEVASFVGKLSGHEVFSKVKMVYCRAASGNSGSAREFRIEMEVPLDRVFITVDSSGKEVANAD